VRYADPIFALHGIGLDVIGEVPSALRKELEQDARATQFHGYVEHVQEHFAAARMAIVPELIGGGFKLKFLDYMFGRVPVAALADASKGLPHAVRSHVLIRDDLPALTSAIVRVLDDLPALNFMQHAAFVAAEGEFQWSERGQRLHAAIARASA
jgi:glycosyltransferase involved in cell wall biosynthesis